MPAIREAFYIARSGRPGPVLVDITKDAQQKSCEFAGTARRSRCRLPARSPAAAASELERAVELIHARRAPDDLRRPRHHPGERDRACLLEFVEQDRHPGRASRCSASAAFPASHPRSLGMMGMHGEAWVNTAIQEADLIIALGMRFDDRVTGNLKTYAPNAKKIHVELDPAEINKNVKVDLALVGDVREILRALSPHVEHRDRSEWIAHIDELEGRRGGARHPAACRTTASSIAAHVIHDLWRLTEGKALVVTDVGQHQMWEAQYYKHDHPRKLITSGGLGTMGFALPAAIGARFALPDDEVWVIAGDGGFQMTAAELATCAQEGIKVNIAIINNGYLGMVRQWQQFFYGGRYVGDADQEPRLREARRGARPHRPARHQPRADRGGGRSARATARHRRDRLPRRAGRQRLPDGPGRRRPRQDDPPAEAASTRSTRPDRTM